MATADRQLAISMIEEALESECRRTSACTELGISMRTYQRWLHDDSGGKDDASKGSRRTAPANKFSDDERRHVLAVVNSAEFASCAPSQIELEFTLRVASVISIPSNLDVVQFKSSALNLRLLP